MTTTTSAPSLVTVTVDGRKVQVAPGTLIIEAAKKAGVVVPHFCYCEKLTPVAACRLCLVEIEGIRGLQPSCAIPVKDGMIVKTDTKDALDSHKEVLDQNLRHHPLDCPKCEAAGSCLLEDFTYEFGPHRVSFYEPPGLSGTDYQENAWSPAITNDPWKCVSCYRCIRVCDEVHNCSALTVDGRGKKLVISTFAGGPLHCDFCGSCASVCPTGAIIQQPGHFLKKDWEYEKREAVCNFCGRGCTVVACVDGDRIAKIEDDFHSGNNKGALCMYGRFAFDAVESPKRIEKPLLRKNGALVEVEWMEALEAAAALLRPAEGRSASLAGIVSGELSLEDIFTLHSFLAAVGAPLFAQSRDGEVSRALSFAGIPLNGVRFSDIAKFRTIVTVDFASEAFDYITMNEVIRAARQKGARLVTVGKTVRRLALYAAEKRDSGLPDADDALYVLQAESVSASVLAEVAKRVAASGGKSRVLVIASSANSRSFGEMGVRNLDSSEGEKVAKIDTLIVAGFSAMKRPSSCRNLIVSSPFRSGFVEEADIVFPSAISFEKPGTYVASDGIAQFSPAVVMTRGFAWPDAAIWGWLANRIGVDTPRTPSAIIKKIRLEHPGFFGGAVAVHPEGKISKANSNIPNDEMMKNGTSEWIRKIREHLAATREFAPWP